MHMILVRNESFKEYLSKYPITSAIIFINTFAFLYTAMTGGLLDGEASNRLGGISFEYIQQKEYYRFISYAFLHASFLHYGFNMFAIILMNPPIELALGKFKYVILFFFTIIGCAMAVIIVGGGATVGSSGFGYGIFGVYSSIICCRKTLIEKQSRTTLLVFITIGLLMNIFLGKLSIAGHLGGLISGIIVGLVFLLTNSIKEME